MSTAESVAKAVWELNSSFEDFEDEYNQDETSNQRAVDKKVLHACNPILMFSCKLHTIAFRQLSKHDTIDEGGESGHSANEASEEPLEIGLGDKIDEGGESGQCTDEATEE